MNYKKLKSLYFPTIVISIAGLIFGACTIQCHAHDQPVHQAIAYSAAVSSGGLAQFLTNNSLALNSILQTGSTVTITNAITNLIRQGAYDEDKFTRCADHFYMVNPSRTPGTVIGMTDNSETLGINFRGLTNSFAWATAPNVFGPSSHTTNIFTWACTRSYEAAALTNSDQTNRNANMAQMFLSLGHVLHLNQDMSQPDHVRNDEHFLGWHRFIENYGSGTYLQQALTNGPFFDYFPLRSNG